MGAVGIVDSLEMIDVHHQDRQRPLVTTCAFGFNGQKAFDLPVVGHAGDRIERSHQFKLVLHGFLFQKPLKYDDGSGNDLTVRKRGH